MGLQGGAAALNSPEQGPWRAATRGGRRAPVGLGGGGGVRGGDGSAEGMTGGSPLSTSVGEGRAERRWTLGQKAN
jgi:hypothetical protein